MMDTGEYEDLLEAVQKLLGGMSDDESEDESEDTPDPKKKGKSLTIISISKAKPGKLKIPKTTKKEAEDELV